MELVPNLEQPKIANLSALVVELLPLSVAGDGHKFVIVLVLQDLGVDTTNAGVTGISITYFLHAFLCENYFWDALRKFSEC